MICGVAMPDGMKENDRFSEPLITPATKAEEGHDEDISREDIIAKGIVCNVESLWAPALIIALILNNSSEGYQHSGIAKLR